MRVRRAVGAQRRGLLAGQTDSQANARSPVHLLLSFDDCVVVLACLFLAALTWLVTYTASNAVYVAAHGLHFINYYSRNSQKRALQYFLRRFLYDFINRVVSTIKLKEFERRER